jgi:hypothetical protein
MERESPLLKKNREIMSVIQDKKLLLKEKRIQKRKPRHASNPLAAAAF